MEKKSASLAIILILIMGTCLCVCLGAGLAVRFWPNIVQYSLENSSLKVGDPAPDFTLRSSELKDVKLSDFKGKKNVVLAFYVLAFTGG